MRHRYSRLNRWIKQTIFYIYYNHKNNEFTNVEGMKEWDFTLKGSYRHENGISAMLRVKNEESKIQRCIESIYPLFDEIIIINNGSTDRTKELILNAIDQHDKKKKIKLYDYPHNIARCGSEHQSTPENSIRSLAYYYNWCLSKCTRKWVFKWDADMIIPNTSTALVKQVLDDIRKAPISLWNVQGQTVYFDTTGKAWASNNEINHEERCFPNSTMIYFKKDKQWERLTSSLSLQEEYPLGVFFYELKDTRENEFSNWTDTTGMSPRKTIEYHNFNAVKRNNINKDLFTEIDIT